MNSQYDLLKKQETTSVLEHPSMLNIVSEGTGPKHISLEWLAGYLDGEGCFITKQHTVCVKVNSCNYDILCSIQDQFGGSITTHGKAKGNSRASWTWAVYGDRAIVLCETLLNHLKEKHVQALALIAWRGTKSVEVKDFLSSQKKTHYEHLDRRDS